MHGYELKRVLSPASPTTQLLNDGVLYPLLKSMERDGLIGKRVERVGKAPSRNVYRPTKRGREEFASWLHSADSEQDEVAYDLTFGHGFAAKCLFFGEVGDEQVRAKLRAQLETSTEKLRTIERTRAGLLAGGVDRYRIAALDLGVMQQHAKLEWIEKTIGMTRRRRARGGTVPTRKKKRTA